MFKAIFVNLFILIISYTSIQIYKEYVSSPRYWEIYHLYNQEKLDKEQVKKKTFEEGQRNVLEQAAKTNHGFFQVDPLDGQSKFYWYTIKIVDVPLPENQKIPPAID